MTLANRITLARIASIPIFCGLLLFYQPGYEWLRWAALTWYALAAISDAADGYIARHLNQRTELGARLDPLADKLLNNLAFVFVAVNAHFDPGVPLWFPVLVLGRDAFIILGTFAVNEIFGPIGHVKPRLLGKLCTASQMAYLLVVLLQLAWAPWLMAIATFFIAASWLDYLATGLRQVIALRRSRAV